MEGVRTGVDTMNRFVDAYTWMAKSSRDSGRRRGKRRQPSRKLRSKYEY